MSVEQEHEVVREGSLEITVYSHGQRLITLVSCPICGEKFDEGQHRPKHFFDEHDFEDLAIGGESA